MRWLLLLLMAVGFAHAAPTTIFGQAGMPEVWDIITGDMDSLIVNTYASLGPEVYSDSAGALTWRSDSITWGSGFDGDLDTVFYVDSGGGTPFEIMRWNEGSDILAFLQETGAVDRFTLSPSTPGGSNYFELDLAAPWVELRCQGSVDHIIINPDGATGSDTLQFCETGDGDILHSEALKNLFDGPVTSTIATTVAGGATGVYPYLEHTTNALTGSLIGVRGSARVNAIDSPAGSVIGGYFQAGNMGVGTDLSVVRGVYTEVVNKVPSGATTWNYARGYEANMDLDQGTSGNANTITDAQIFYGVYNLPTVGTYATVTNGYGVFIRNEAVGGTGQMLDAIFYGDDLNHSGGIFGWDFGLDFSGITSGAFGTADIRGCNGETIDNITNGQWSLNADAIQHGAGTVGDADIVWSFDSGGGGTALKTYDEGNEQLEFNVPVQVPELDVVEAGDAITVGVYNIDITIPPGAAALGPTAPSWVVVGTFGGLEFDADAERVSLDIEVPDDYTGADSLTLKIYWTNEPADAIADTETCKFDILWRAIDFDGGEDIENGTAETGTVTYTQTGAGGDGDTRESTIILPHDGGNQTISSNDVLGIQFDRDVSGDTYSGGAYLIRWELSYPSDGLATHL